jgi:hypothetical protein
VEGYLNGSLVSEVTFGANGQQAQPGKVLAGAPIEQQQQASSNRTPGRATAAKQQLSTIEA